jgi:transcription initiation factor IIE alpha subunit
MSAGVIPVFYCDYCGSYETYTKQQFCPKCGTELVEGEDEVCSEEVESTFEKIKANKEEWK